MDSMATRVEASIFLSTPSARRATPRILPRSQTVKYFYPRPPRGGRLRRCSGKAFDQPISIHALREEGDAGVMSLIFKSWKFLSTPSARRATGWKWSP